MVKGGHPLQPDWRSSSHKNRIEAIRPLVEGRSVLDVGAASGRHRPDWVHGQIAKLANRVVGIDIDQAGVEQIQQMGNYDVRLVNAQDMDLGERFDVVFAGEIIEHLANFESFLRGVLRHLKPDGRLILTTPNVFCFSYFVYRIGFSPRIHPEHTCWFCKDTLSALVRRCGFVVEDVRYIPQQTTGRLRKLFAGLVRLALPEHLKWNTLLLIARPEPGNETIESHPKQVL